MCVFALLKFVGGLDEKLSLGTEAGGRKGGGGFIHAAVAMMAPDQYMDFPI